MIAIEVPRREDDPKTVDSEQLPLAIITAVKETLEAYPTVSNTTTSREFDRLFEKLYNCNVEYYEDGIASRIVWPDDRDYTIFLLKWS